MRSSRTATTLRGANSGANETRNRQPRSLDEERARLGLLRLEGRPYDKYYYSYDLGAWHIVVLNSDCWRIEGCELGDPQINGSATT